MNAILEARELTKRFAGVVAVDECSLSVRGNTITGLIGPNGSGKTTLFNLLTGYLRADAGSVVFGGHTHRRPDPARLYRHGLSRTFQQARVFPTLTAMENLVVAAGKPWWSLAARRLPRAEVTRARQLLAEFTLTEHADVLAGELSYGQRKLLEFAAVLMSSPRLVLLDEPTAGVNPVVIETMERRIRERHAAGITFLIVEHDMNLVMRLCDPVIVLDRGAVIATGPPAQVQSDPAVLDAYLGG
ncbi:MAG TPA: ABC transporter ATP-binding protein [Pseudonocardiaceae bacterium]|jgi:ABC-type branched-subunit amino acid transport system ATPase component|nr:ABC transporter ATP-binding protein [Pseudonocardiaceae bacterium]